MSAAALDASQRLVDPVELAPGYFVAPVITGCWQLSADHGAASGPFEDLCRRWREGLEAGFTTFDCADIYTGVEELLGRFLKSLDDTSRVQIHSKYVPNRGDLATLDRGAVAHAIERSLERLGRESLDLLQFHWWDYEEPGAVETLIWLDELRRDGKIRHLAVTNFDLEHLRVIVAAGVELTAAQVQYSVLDRRPGGAFASWCAKHEIALLCYGTLAGGLLTSRFAGAPDLGERIDNRSLTKYRLIVDEVGGWPALQEVLTALAAVARRQGVTIPVAALRWVLDQPGVAAAVVGASRRARWTEYRGLWQGGWEAETWPELREALERWPGPQGSVYGLERDPDGVHMPILRMDLNAD